MAFISISRLVASIAKFLNKFKFIKDVLRVIRFYIFKKSYTHKIHEGVSFQPVPKEKDESTFFGYYTNSYINSDGIILYHSIQKSLDTAQINVLDSNRNNRIEVGHTSAWNWQQGSMLQWIPSNKNWFIFNKYDANTDSYYASLHDVTSLKEIKRFDVPVYAVKKDGFLSLSFERLEKYRPDYGYSNHRNDQLSKLSQDGIWFCDFDNNHELIITLDELVKNMPYAKENCWVNHIQVSPSGNRMIFFLRWFENKEKTNYRTKLIAFDFETKALNELHESNDISHYDWVDESTILIWADVGSKSGYKLLNITTKEVNSVAYWELPTDGHPSIYKPNKEIFLTDTYPDKSRMSKLILYNQQKQEKMEIGEFYQPLSFNGPDRCDLHPRWGINTRISFDSAHSGQRQMYLADIKSLL